ncbi:MAG: hypothetical protein E6Q83_14530 [Thiothrix sp.]|nr:MAG: hypothetical protein E6Q83_14530 [Thiothrix sp.]
MFNIDGNSLANAIKEARKVINDLNPLLWFLTMIAFLYVVITGIKAIAPEGIYLPSKPPIAQQSDSLDSNTSSVK